MRMLIGSYPVFSTRIVDLFHLGLKLKGLLQAGGGGETACGLDARR